MLMGHAGSHFQNNNRHGGLFSPQHHHAPFAMDQESKATSSTASYYRQTLLEQKLSREREKRLKIQHNLAGEI